MWMLDYRSRILNCAVLEVPLALWMRPRMKILMNQHNYGEIGSYSDRHVKEVYLELRRIQNTLYWSLDDFFVYEFRGKSLEQIICEYIGLNPDI